jgi:hypothetical protein
MTNSLKEAYNKAYINKLKKDIGLFSKEMLGIEIPEYMLEILKKFKGTKHVRAITR